MQEEFEMSMIGELNHFLGLQICQQELGIFISQSKYAKNLVKKFGLKFASPVSEAIFVRSHMSPIGSVIFAKPEFVLRSSTRNLTLDRIDQWLPVYF